MSNGANSIHKQLRSELEDYIKAQYFGRSPRAFSPQTSRKARINWPWVSPIKRRRRLT